MNRAYENTHNTFFPLFICVYFICKKFLGVGKQSQYFKLYFVFIFLPHILNTTFFSNQIYFFPLLLEKELSFSFVN